MSYRVRRPIETDVRASISTPVLEWDLQKAIILIDFIDSQISKSIVILFNDKLWQRGISSEVFFAPFIAENLAAAKISPFLIFSFFIFSNISLFKLIYPSA